MKSETIGKGSDFKEIDIKALKINPFAMLDDEWALVSAGNAGKFNTMTISWGAMGIMWNKPVALVFLRPQRYTKEFLDSLDLFTVSFYPADYKKALEILGAKSGRDSNKISESGLTPYFVDGTVAFGEAHTVFVCRKLFGGQQLEASKFVDARLDTAMYPDKDHHFLYFGEIKKALVCKST